MTEVNLSPMIITANALLVWFVWGFFMALGWTLGAWIMGLILGWVPIVHGPVVVQRPPGT